MSFTAKEIADIINKFEADMRWIESISQIPLADIRWFEADMRWIERRFVSVPKALASLV